MNLILKNVEEPEQVATLVLQNVTKVEVIHLTYVISVTVYFPGADVWQGYKCTNFEIF